MVIAGVSDSYANMQQTLPSTLHSGSGDYPASLLSLAPTLVLRSIPCCNGTSSMCLCNLRANCTNCANMQPLVLELRPTLNIYIKVAIV
jgi:hypothetical protein